MKGLRLLFLVVALPATGRADESGNACPRTVTEWAGRAGVEAIRCRPNAAVVRLVPVGAPPLEVDVGEPPGDAFRHAGRLRVSPIVEVADYELLPAAQRAAFERFVGWLEANEHSVSFSPAARVPGARWTGPWLILLALLAGLLGLWRLAVPRADWLSLAVLFAVSVVGRLLLGVWGPFRINGLGPLWINAAAVDPSLVATYGPGYPELFSPIARLFSHSSDYAIFAANAVLSAAIPPCVFAVARTFGLDRTRALLPAGFLCVDLASIRFAATESYLPSIIAFALAAQLLLLLAARSWSRRSVLLALAAAALCAEAARIHPVAWIPVALTPIAVIGLAEQWSLKKRASAVGVASLAILVAVVATSGVEIAARIPEAARFAPSQLALPILLPIALAAVIAFLPVRWQVLPGAVWLLACLVTRKAYGQSPAWQAAYDRLFLAMPLISLAALIPRRATDWRPMKALALALAAALAVFAVLGHGTLTTEQLEYRWARAQLRNLPQGCAVLHVERAGRRALLLPQLPGHPVRSTEVAFAPGACGYYLHSSLCASADGRPLCDAFEASLHNGHEVARQVLPARPSNSQLPYDRDTVEIALLRIGE